MSSSTGAVATMFDISCLYGTKLFDNIQDLAYNIWENIPAHAAPEQATSCFRSTPPILGVHYFITNPITGTGISPKWDFATSYDGNPDAFVVAAKVANLAAPTGTHDVDWLQLKNVQGGLADAVYRVDTKGGQPPASVSLVIYRSFPLVLSRYYPLQCDPGSSISVKYTAKYCKSIMGVIH
jgi:hypothetical protein